MKKASKEKQRQAKKKMEQIEKNSKIIDKPYQSLYEM